MTPLIRRDIHTYTQNGIIMELVILRRLTTLINYTVPIHCQSFPLLTTQFHGHRLSSVAPVAMIYGQGAQLKAEPNSYLSFQLNGLCACREETMRAAFVMQYSYKAGHCKKYPYYEQTQV